MKVLKDVSVLLVGEAPAELDLLTVWVRSEGAKLQTSTWDSALTALAQTPPTAVVMDLRDQPEAGHALLARMRADAALARIPAIALVERTRSSAALETAPRASFQKQIATPIHPADLISALVGLAPQSSSEQAPAELVGESVVPTAPSRGVVLAGLLKSKAEKKDMRGLLQLLNATGPFRFTSILRFDGEQLASVWTFDREDPLADSFPIDKAVAESYCSLVRAADAPVSIPDVAGDASLDKHPARHTVLSYCGVPLRREDESFFGTLCHFDLAPRLFAESTIKRLEETAALLREHLPGPAAGHAAGHA